jgi:hypothetical protein
MGSRPSFADKFRKSLTSEDAMVTGVHQLEHMITKPAIPSDGSLSFRFARAGTK